MTEGDLAYVQGVRDVLIARLNRGIFQPVVWRAVIDFARKYGCDAIADQMEDKMKHYQQETK